MIFLTDGVALNFFAGGYFECFHNSDAFFFISGVA
jgi:hypothetical protein